MQRAPRQYRCQWIEVISRALPVMNDGCCPRGSTAASRVMDGRPARVRKYMMQFRNNNPIGSAPTRGLSPEELVGNVSPSVHVAVFVGAKDDVVRRR